MKLHLLLTGNELMSGDTVDSNSSRIAHQLAHCGLRVARKVTVGDDLTLLVSEIKQASKASDILLINGGLGPTIDDLTAQALALAAEVELCEHPEASHHVKSWCEKRGFPSNAANMTQAMLPVGVEVLANPVGSAVGFSLNLNGCVIMCTPGVPSELAAMLEQVISPMLRARFPDMGAPSILRLKTFGVGESGFQQRVNDALPDWPKEVELGFRAGAPLLEIKLTINDASHADLRDQCERQLFELFGDYIIGNDDITLAECVIDLLKKSNAKLTTAESCTGGLIASLITEVPGASQVFEAGVVSYSNAVKKSVLNVSATDLEVHGAVSESVVRQMALGALAISNANYAIAVSGVAGPDGGSDDKPAGTVCVAWGHKDNIKTSKLYFPVARKLFQTMTAAVTLDLIRRELAGIKAESRYFASRKVG
ncbi:MAG: CinA family nicotinamide mononucleotide deamidase-related protein [Pseudomonadales bacterium]